MKKKNNTIKELFVTYITVLVVISIITIYTLYTFEYNFNYLPSFWQYIVTFIGITWGSILLLWGVARKIFKLPFLLPPILRKVEYHPPRSVVNTKALEECFKELKEGDELNMVMGELYGEVCGAKEVLESIKEAMKKDVKIKIVHGPTVDKSKKTQKFLEALKKGGEKVEIHRLDYRPQEHFRVIKKKDGSISEEIWIEELHSPKKDRGYWKIKSPLMAEDYYQLFDKLFNPSK